MTIPIKAAREKLSDTAAGKRRLQGKSIPFDVIEAILSKLPVKSLIRFQILSKSCKAIISTPSFAKISHNHLPKPHNLFLHGSTEEELPFSLMRSEGGSILQKEAEFDAPFGPADLLCSCNGIVLLVTRNNPSGGFVLWNPCTRKHTMIQIPLPAWSELNARLYHDSRTDDYKVAIVSEKGSMVYSCKTRTWAEEELIPSTRAAGGDGLLVDGCLYWHKEPRHRGGPILRTEIMCFDFRGRKTEELKLPEHFYGRLRLTRLQGRLCLDPLDTYDRVWVRENHGWRDLTDMTKKGVQLCHGRRIVVVGYGKAAYVGCDCSIFVIYNDCEERFEELREVSMCNDCGESCEELEENSCVFSNELVPYSESLLFPFEV